MWFCETRYSLTISSLLYQRTQLLTSLQGHVFESLTIWLTLWCWQGLPGLVVNPDVFGYMSALLYPRKVWSGTFEARGNAKACQAFVPHRCNRSALQAARKMCVTPLWRKIHAQSLCLSSGLSLWCQKRDCSQNLTSHSKSRALGFFLAECAILMQLCYRTCYGRLRSTLRCNLSVMPRIHQCLAAGSSSSELGPSATSNLALR